MMGKENFKSMHYIDFFFRQILYDGVILLGNSCEEEIVQKFRGF